MQNKWMTIEFNDMKQISREQTMQMVRLSKKKFQGNGIINRNDGGIFNSLHLYSAKVVSNTILTMLIISKYVSCFLLKASSHSNLQGEKNRVGNGASRF